MVQGAYGYGDEEDEAAGVGVLRERTGIAILIIMNPS